MEKLFESIWQVISPALSKYLDKLGVLGLLSLVFALVLVYVGYLYFKGENDKSDLEKKLHESEIKWEKIQPVLKLKSKLDIEKNIVFEYEISKLPEKPLFLEDGLRHSKNFDGLSYEKTSMKKLHRSFTNNPPFLCLEEFFELSPVHIWKGQSEYNISFDEEGVRKLIFYPHITVQKIPLNKIKHALINFSSCFISSDEYKEAYKKQQTEGELNTIELSDYVTKYLNNSVKIDSIDVVGVYWTLEQFINVFESIFNPNINLSISQVQKARYIFKATYIKDYKNARISFNSGDYQPGELRLMRHVILVKANPSVYIIKIDSPTLKHNYPNKKFDAKFKEWLADFRILIK